MENKITTSVELITPQKASEYLSHNTMNRTLNDRRLTHYAYQMKTGQWVLNTSDAIVFAEDGTLLNGQHRLHAVITSCVPTEFLVTRGADKDSFVVMDTGRVRNGGDVLAIKGYVNSRTVSSIITFYILTFQKHFTLVNFEGSRQSRVRAQVSNEDILIEYESSPHLYQAIATLAIRVYKKYRLYTPAYYGGVCTHLVKDKLYDIAKVEEFYEALNEGNGYEYLDFLRMKIIRSMTRTSDKEKISADAKLVMLSKAWNYFIAGEDRKIIPYKLGDKMRFD